MRLLPYARFVLQVALDAPGVTARIHAATREPARATAMPAPLPAFRGWADGNRFELVPVFGRRGGESLTLLRGRILARGSRRTRVSVVATLRPLALGMTAAVAGVVVGLVVTGRGVVGVAVGVTLYVLQRAVFARGVEAARVALERLL